MAGGNAEFQIAAVGAMQQCLFNLGNALLQQGFPPTRENGASIRELEGVVGGDGGARGGVAAAAERAGIRECAVARGGVAGGLPVGRCVGAGAGVGGAADELVGASA